MQIYPHSNDNPAMQSLMQPLLQGGVLSRADMKRLAGNGMHQPTVASIVLYTLATLHRVNKRPSLLSQLLPDAAEETDGPDDDAAATSSAAMRRIGSVISDGDGGDGLSF